MFGQFAPSRVFTIGLLSICLLPGLSALADDVYWQDTGGDWFNPDDWFDQTQNSNLVPRSSDDVYIDNSGAPWIKAGSATAYDEYVGYNAGGRILQTGGINSIENIVWLGRNTGSSGSYLLGMGSLSAGDEAIGIAGTGVFTQGGGANVAGNLDVGGNNVGDGTYNLDGGSLAVGWLSVGTTGRFNLFGGSATFSHATFDGSYYQISGDVTIDDPNGSGTLRITDGTLIVGPTAGGQLGQIYVDGGNLQVDHPLAVASLLGDTTLQFGSASGDLDQASITVQGNADLNGSLEIVPTGPIEYSTFPLLTAPHLTGSLNLKPSTIGRLTITPSIQGNSIIATVSNQVAALTWNNTAGGDGITWDLQNNKNWTSTAAVGDPNEFYTFDNALFNDNNNGNYTVDVISGGVQAGTITVDTSGIYTFTGGPVDQGFGTMDDYGFFINRGTLVVTNTIQGQRTMSVDGGTLEIASPGNVAIPQVIGKSATGICNQTGGTNSGGASLGWFKGSVGQYNLVAGSLANVGAGYSGTGIVVQTGGTVTGSIELGLSDGGVGTYTLINGTINTSSQSIGEQMFSTGTFTQLGGNNSTEEFAEGVFSGSVGIYTLSGGTLSISGHQILGGAGADPSGGTAIFHQNGGTNTIGAYGALEIGAGYDSTGDYDLAGGELVVNGYTFIGGSPISGVGNTGILAVSGKGQFNTAHPVTIYLPGLLSINGGTATMGVFNLIDGRYSQSAGSVTVGQFIGTGHVVITGGETKLATGGHISQISDLTMDFSGRLDITDNTLDINYIGASPAATIRGYLASGIDGYKWDGPGIDSSLAGVVQRGAAVGYIDTGSQIIVRYTWFGDVNLDGVVNSADFQVMNKSVTGGAPAIWANGDLNYDGQIDADDFALFALGVVISNGHTIPEPAVLEWAILGVLFCLRRKS